jgi:fibronectin type 3 domain-containing protein
MVSTAPIKVETTTYVDVTIENGRMYYYQIVAVDKDTNVSLPSIVAYLVIPDAIPPGVPTGLKGKPTKNKSILISWDPNPEKDLFGYLLLRGKTPDDLLPASNDVIRNAASFEDKHVDAGAVYYYVLTAIDTSSNESKKTEPVAVVAPDWEPPEAPMGLFADGADGAITVSWAPNQELDMAAYRVYTSDRATGTYNKIGEDIASGTTSFIHKPVESGIKYWYKLTAVDTSGNESKQSAPVYGLCLDDVPPEPPAAPVGAFGAPGSPGEKTVKLTWAANNEKDIAGYAVYRAAISRTGIVEKISGSALLPPDRLSFEDKTLKPGVEYWYVLRAWDTSGNRSLESETAGPFKIEPEKPTAGTGAGATSVNPQSGDKKPSPKPKK